MRRGEPAVFVVPAPFLVPGHLANPAQPADPQASSRWAVLASLQGTVTVLADAGFSDAEAIAWLFTADDVLDARPIDALAVRTQDDGAPARCAGAVAAGVVAASSDRGLALVRLRRCGTGRAVDRGASQPHQS